MLDYVNATEKIPQIASDGEVSLKELASLGMKPTTEAVKDQKKAVDDVQKSWNQIPKNVKTVYTIEVHGEVPSTGGGGPVKVGAKAGGGLVNEGLWYLHDDEVVLNRAQRMGNEPIPQGWAPGVSKSVSIAAINVYGASGMDATDLARAIKNELGREVNTLINSGAGMMGM
jgi:hypothetical protein